MLHQARFSTLALLLLALGVTTAPAVPSHRGARHLTFEQRVQAQRAIEQVYYTGRTGSTRAARPLAEAVPRALLERKVRTYLAQSAAMETVWNSPISAAALRRELERIAADTQLPDRLKAIYAALDNDSFVIQETLARAALAHRLARAYAPDAEDAPEAKRAQWTANRDVDLLRVPEVAEPLESLPQPGAGTPSCGFQDLWGGGDSDAPPAGRSGHTAVWTGSEMIVWGGGSLNTGGLYDPLLDTWRPTSLTGAPSGRTEHTAVWTGSEMIVWGGSVPGTTLGNGGRYDPAANAWTPMSMVGAPSPRGNHTAVWIDHEMIVWGGWPLGGSPLGTGARYDPSTDTWAPTSLTDAPLPRYYHVAVSTGSEMIVWGATTSTGGVYDPAADTWRPTSLLNAPGPRYLTAAVWTGTEMIIWGGSNGGFAPGGGRYNPATDVWRPTSASGAPLNRSSHTAVWNGSRMILWGGQDFSQSFPNPLVNTGALYDPVADTWAPTSLVGAPSARSRHSAVWTGDRMIVWGGQSVNTGGRYDPATDSWLPTNSASSSLSARVSHTAVWTGSEMIVWGGTNSDSSGGLYDPLLDTWTATSLLNAPSPRKYHTAVWTGEQMIVWGGQSGTSGPGLDTGGRYDPTSDIWLPTTLLGAPSLRAHHTAVWTGQEMIVWGGKYSDNTGGRYDPLLDRWTPTPLLNAPSPRNYHTAVWTGEQMIVWGGAVGGGFTTNTGGRYDPLLDTWSPTTLVDAPWETAGHTAVWTGSAMLVWDGLGGSYDPLLDAWTPIPTAGAPFERWGYSAVWTGSEMIIWGGAYQDNFFYTYSTNTGGRFDPAAGTWAPTTTVNAPGSRELHTAVWTGSAMIVRGGERYTGDVVELAQDLRTAWYGAASAAPSPDDDGDGFPLCAADCDDADPAVSPGGLQICGDGRNNDCSHPAWPSLAGTNETDDDADGVSECAGDCDDANGAVHGTPAEVAGLAVEGSAPALLGWSPVSGGAARYDVLRSAARDDFVTNAICLESDDPSDTAASDSEPPPVGGIFYYLIRAENACPGALGTGPLGFTSGGQPRQGRACP